MRDHSDPMSTVLPGLGRDPASVRRRIAALEQLLEHAITVPVINRRIGMDALLGLVPVAGDVVAGALGLWLVWEAHGLGMSRLTLARMIGNIGFDTLLGAIPLVGDVFDFAFRSNSRNLRLIKRHLDRHHPGTAIV